ncbi:FKBP-type peptidyl-prolyl cis-trans isomerase [Hymenobacter sp. BT175]|uniref:FKBP-type peptidyl-prolyl cis-trans isomerase n=1 Tax=Hymenobacter translucens TaxID=2886507 RepID=UPI001D0EB7D9|nr:FKBP-type peptidyl-prolyl cis-trans isomerase [Hymenobacter translucens]MCC2547531.1 FKBP-type peptidyl-prolyl cis-trans isomerase [Hymenobacter translucens]
MKRRLFFLVLGLVLLLSAGARAQQARPDTVRTDSGLRYVVHQRGPGSLPKPGSRIVAHYTGFLPNGRMFESSATTGPLRFRLGRGEVIRGWDEVFALLPAGSRVRVWIPAALAYGAKGVRNPDDESQYQIPPDTDLIFELEVVKIK